MIVGVDIGGTKTLVGCFAVGSDQPKLINQKRFATQKDFSTELEKLVETIKELGADEKISRVVIGSRGEIHNTGKLTDKKILGWVDVPIAQKMEESLGCPVGLYHDTALAALAEGRLGSGKEHSCVLYCTISSGIGTGFTLDGKVIFSSSGGGDMVLGQTELNEKSLEHTFEHLWSGSAIKHRFGKEGRDISEEGVWEQIAAGLAVGLNNLIVITQPDIVVIGGGIGVHFDRYSAELRGRLEQFGTSQYPAPVLSQAKFLEDGVIYGGALIGQEIGSD